MNDSMLARQPNPLPNPFRPGNGVAPPHLAGRDRLLAAYEDWLLEDPPLHANWALSGLRVVYRPPRATYDFALPLFGPYLRRRPKLTKLSSRR